MPGIGYETQCGPAAEPDDPCRLTRAALPPAPGSTMTLTVGADTSVLQSTISKIESAVDDVRAERDYYKQVILDLAKEIDPLTSCLQLNARNFEAEMKDPRWKDRVKLFAVLDMFLVQANGLPNAAAIKRADDFAATVNREGTAAAIERYDAKIQQKLSDEKAKFLAGEVQSLPEHGPWEG